MRIIKPYGRTVVEKSGSERPKRVLSYQTDPALGIDPGNREDVGEFVASHDTLVIAQWISTIDKIARKPSGENRATREQAEFRRRLGDAAWALIERRNLIADMADPAAQARLRKLWDFKIAPYEIERNGARKGRAPPSAKGRWYARFADGVEDVGKVDATKVAERIHEHLYLAQYQMRGYEQVRSEGLISARAKSISGNVLRPRPLVAARENNSGWTEEDRRRYERAGDVARNIRSAAERRETGDGKARPGRVTSEIAGEALYKHYAGLFIGRDGKVLPIAKAREQQVGLFNLHTAVKDCYSRILKSHKKDLEAHGERRRRVSTLLPDSSAALFRLVDAMGDNRDLNALVRLGRVIHYECAADSDDRPADVVANWRDDVTGSEYWTSDGQARIKRNEALVRVWRHVLALAHRTLTDWADPEGRIGGDILLSGNKVMENFDSGSYARKVALLFGNRAGCSSAMAATKISRKRSCEPPWRGLRGFAMPPFISRASADLPPR